MTVKQLKTFLGLIQDDNKEVYFYGCNDNPFDDFMNVQNVFEVSNDASGTGNFEGVYLKGN